MSDLILAIERAYPHNFPAPQRQTEGAAGYDLVTTKDLVIGPGERVLAPTGWKMVINTGWCGQIWPRSGLAVKHGLDRLAGLIDSDYRGEVKVALINEGPYVIQYEAGTRIGQIVFVPHAEWSVVEFEELPTTDRGGNGFGSTGKG